MADRKRKTNWSSEECVVLVDKCVENTATVTGKFTKQLSAHCKKDFWANTCEIFRNSRRINIENEILEESKNRNSLLRDIGKKMDTMIQLKTKINLMEKQFDIQILRRLTEMMFET